MHEPPSQPEPTLYIKAQPLTELIELIRPALERGPVTLEAPHPASTELFEGELYHGADGALLRFRSLRAWLELAELLGAELSLRAVCPERELLRFTLRSAQLGPSWHERSLSSGDPEKYGRGSIYARLNKLEEPSLYGQLNRALSLARATDIKRALIVGCHQGDELRQLSQWLGERSAGALLMGVDHSKSAIEEAQRRAQAMSAQHHELSFTCADARELEPERFGELELLISINLLHSPALDGHALFKSWVKRLLKPSASVIIGLPCCRYEGVKLRYGAQTVHGGQGELSLLLTDAMFYVRYLRQQGFQVYVVGRYNMLIVGRR